MGFRFRLFTLGLQVYRYFILWALESKKITHFGPFGAPRGRVQGFTVLGFRVQLGLMILKVNRGFRVLACE